MNSILNPYVYGCHYCLIWKCYSLFLNELQNDIWKTLDLNKADVGLSRRPIPAAFWNLIEFGDLSRLMLLQRMSRTVM